MSADVLQFPDVAASLAVGTASDETAAPDRAARAIQLSAMTGVNPNAIWGDVEGFERQTKGQMAGDLVRNNPHLAEYMLDDPMNARLSIDDLGNLDVATQAAEKLNNDGVMATFAKNFLTGRTGLIGIASDLASNVDRIGTAAVAAYDFAGQQQEFQKLLAEPWVKPFLAGIGPIGATAAAGAVSGFDSFMRLFNAAMVGASEAAGVLYEANTGDAAMGRRLVRDVYALLQIGTAGPGIFGGSGWVKMTADAQLKPIVKQIADPLRAAAPYLKEGKEPPLGLHPEIDKLKAEQAKFDLQNLDDALSEAQKSSTREADPDRYAALMRMVNKGKIGINVDAIDRIYGDKPALPDDGKLGWVQGINEQIALARETGGDVEVPIADWLAHVDPQVAKELHDDLRVRPQQPTVNDLAAAKEQRAETQPKAKQDLDSRLEALENEFNQGGRDDSTPVGSALQLAVGFAQVDSTINGVPRGFKAVDDALQNGRRDIAEAIVERAERSADTYNIEPGVEKGSPKYDSIAADLQKRKQEATEFAGKLRNMLEGKPVNDPRPVSEPVPPRPTSPVESVRAASALEPTLKRVSGEGTEHSFDILDPEGKPAGYVNIEVEQGGRVLYVESMSAAREGQANIEGANKLGPSQVRSLLRQLKKEFPEAEEVVGVRFSGAREAAGKENRTARMKLDQGEPVAKEQRAETHKGEDFPKAGLVVANKDNLGNIYVGKPGDLHFSLAERHGKEVREQNAKKPGEWTWAEEGFVNPEGEFLTRQEALEWVQKNERPSLREEENMRGEGLDADQYRNSVPENRKKKRAESVPPRPTSPVESVRAAAALEPMFALGDRKLELKQKGMLPDEGFGAGHTFEMLNEKGQPVGALAVSIQDSGKTIYIDHVLGTHGHDANSFGPSLIRDMLRQLREQFPEAEKIGGFRISGAREKAGAVREKGEMSLPTIRLDAPDGWTFVEGFDPKVLKEGGEWERISQNFEQYVRPTEALDAAEKAIYDKVTKDLERIVPKGVDYRAADQIRRIEGGPEPLGSYVPYSAFRPLLSWTLDDTGAAGTARHEAIHHLRQYNFFTPQEWTTLRKAALSEKWIEKYDINNRYKGLDLEGKIEEAIADGFKKWYLGKEAAPKELLPIFERIKELVQLIKDKAREVLGHEPTWEELFRKVERGEIGSREPGTPRIKGAFDVREARPEQLDLGQDLIRMEDRAAFDKAAAIGMTVDQYKRYMKLIEERQKADFEKEMAKAEKEQKKRQSAEWKAEANAMYPEVAKEMANRPDIAADRFLRDGILYGEKVDKIRIGEEYLTPEQREGLPKAYVAKKGMHPDDVAGLFGYDSGAAMVARLAQFDREWRDSGVRREDFFRKMTEAEVERRMELKHGSLEENILAEAKDQALSETQLQLLHEETLALATQAGAQFAIPKDVLANQIKENFAKYPVDTVSSDRLLADAGRAGRAAEMALLKKDFAEAFRQKQRQYVAVTLAKEAGKLEKEQAQFAKLEKRYAKERPNDPEERREFNNYIQDLLQQAGYKVKLSPEQIQGNFDHYGNVPLTDFAAAHNSYGGEVYVAPFIAEGRLRQMAGKMTVEEWRDFRDTIQSLDHNGREIGAIEIAGAKQEFADWRKGVIENIKALPKRDATQQRQGGRWLYGVDASITRMEEIVKDLDLRKELGPLFEGLIAPMMRSKAKEFDMVTELSKYFKEQKGANKEWRKTLGDAVPNDFLIDPATRVPYDLTRENMIQIMLNWGTESNRLKFNQGYASLELGRKATKEEAAQFGLKVQHLLDTHATAEDWKFVQQMWQPFKGWKGEADKVSRNVSGIAPKWIPEAEVVTPHGTFEGGYWPVKYDKIGSDMEVVRGKQVGDGPLGSQYFRAATSKNYLKERTGYVDFVDITTSLEQAAGVMQQTIHDIAFRDAVVQASKIIYDKQIRAAIRNHYGIEYERQLEPWLKRVANPNTVDDHGIAAINSFLRRVRINLVGHALPLNLKVILSPDIGRPDPRVWTAFESDRAANVKLAMEQSNEIRHMVYNMDRDYRESMEGMVKRGVLDAAQRKAVEWGFAPMMKVSQEFRMATFVHEWNKAKAKGHTDSQAAQIADSIVREQHGAASIVDLPSAMASSEGMKMLTMFYGYFNTMYNWQRQLPGQIRRGEAKNAMWTSAGAIGVGAAYGAALFNKGKEDDSWWKIIGKALMLQPLQTVPILRDAANMYIEGNRPSTPVASIMNTMSSLYTDLKRKHEGKPMQRPIQNIANVVGPLTGLPLAQVGRTGEFLYDVATGQSRPKNILEWWRGIVHGEIKAKK